MKDLELAKNLLKENALSLAIVKAGRLLYGTREHSMIGMVKAIESHGAELIGASVADRVVGKAAAMLCRYAGVAEVYAHVISEKGLRALKEGGTKVEYFKIVPEILDRNGRETCPFEKLVANCGSEEECYKRIKEYFDSTQ